MPPASPTFTLFVSCVDGKPVARFRIGGGTSGVFGARLVKPDAPTTPAPRGIAGVIALRDATRPRLKYDVDAVIAISAEEDEEFGRIYRRAIAEGDLRERTAEEHAAYLGAQRAREEAALASAQQAPAAAEQPAAPAEVIGS